MRAFAKASGIERLSLEARIVYTAFSIFMLLGFASSAWLYTDDGLGATTASAERYYLGTANVGDAGSEAGHLAGEAVAKAGPALELPEESDAGVERAPSSGAIDLRLAKPPRQVMETFHFHLFSVALCLLVVAHLFMMCRLSTAAKAWVIGLGAAATLLHVGLPPLVRLASPAFAALVFPSALAMTLAWGVMTLWPVVEMWRGRRASDGA